MISRRIIRRWALVCLAGCWVPVVSLAGGQQDGSTFDLPSCIRQVLKANPRMEEATLDVEHADLELRSAKLSRAPKVELFNRFGIAEDAEGDAITGEDVEGSYGPFNRLDLLFTQPLYTFGRITNVINAALGNVESVKASRLKTTSDLILHAHKRYYGYVLARQLLKTTRDIQKNFAETYDLAQERLDQGDARVTETDALKLKVGLSVITKTVYQIERRLRMAQESLREIMGLDDTIAFQIADRKITVVDFTPRALDHYLSAAREKNPDIRRLKAAAKAEEALYLAERSKYYPTLLALGGVRHAAAPGRDNQDNPFLNDDFNYFNAGVSLGLKWDLSFMQTHTDIKKQKIRYKKMKTRLDRVRDGVDLAVKDKYHRYQEKMNGLEASFEAKKAGRALLFLNLSNFKLGLGSGKDVFDSLSLHARTDGDYVKALFEYNMAVFELMETAGQLSVDRYPAS